MEYHLYLHRLVDALIAAGYSMQELVERRIGSSRIVIGELKS